METAPNTKQDMLPLQERLLQQQNLCIEARCKLIGARGCILEGILPLAQRISQAEPCSRAVAEQPRRQRRLVA